MAFLQVQFFSRTLEVASTVNVILPEPSQGIGVDAAQAAEPPKVLYLLHGYSDDHSIWLNPNCRPYDGATHSVQSLGEALALLLA